MKKKKDVKRAENWHVEMAVILCADKNRYTAEQHGKKTVHAHTGRDMHTHILARYQTQDIIVALT